MDQEPARISFSGHIHLIQNDHELTSHARSLNSAREFGFDTETRPSFRKGEVYNTAILQLATDDDAFLIRLHGITNFQPILAILENAQVLKVGVALRDDLKQLQKTFRFTPRGFIELQDVAKEKGLQNRGLKGLALEVLGGQLSKGPKLTNWEARELTAQQLMYAATDAWIGLHLYRNLKDRAPLPPPNPVPKTES